VLLSVYLTLRASLPVLDGQIDLPGLSAPVTVVRDDHGVPTIRGENRLDVVRVTGFVHAQERYFQMDLQRRKAAGELSALVGSAALGLDRASRLHRFRQRAQEIVAAASDGERAIIETYTEGVNAGLAALGAKPFEYFLLRTDPEPWRQEDMILTIHAMYFELNDETARRESGLGLLKDVLPPAYYDWLVQPGTSWDAPMMGDAVTPKPIPGPNVYDLGKLDHSLFAAVALPAGEQPVNDSLAGSNNWAVAGTYTGSGRAIVANDMHMGLNVPNIWFRARLVVHKPGVDEPELDITGVILPGTPAVAVGSNGHVAWAFTNSHGDWVDLVEIETNPLDDSQYRTASGFRNFEDHEEVIELKGGGSVVHTVRETIWGPVVDSDHEGTPRVIRWIAHDPEGANVNVLKLEEAEDVHEAMDLANRVGSPPQNFVVADSTGSIAWTVMGPIPIRQGYDPLQPSSWADGAGWQGWLSPRDYPRMVNPPLGRIWTANARVADGEMLAKIGQGGYALGARAGQIRDALLADDALSIDDMLAVQLDDRALFLTRWQEYLLELLSGDALDGNPERSRARELIEDWGGHASVDSVGYRLVRAYRLTVRRAVLDALTAELRTFDPEFVMTEHNQTEDLVWQLINERPRHLLNSRHSTWTDFLLTAADEASAVLNQGQDGETQQTWGSFNRLEMRHPLSRAVPQLSRWLDMPATSLPGDSDMPRVQKPTFGASQRLVVSPGAEEDGFFHMPGGQSGHPLSPFYRRGHDDWIDGRAAGFLPGKERYRLVFGVMR
jgi:penicillin amidase